MRSSLRAPGAGLGPAAGSDTIGVTARRKLITDVASALSLLPPVTRPIALVSSGDALRGASIAGSWRPKRSSNLG